MSVSLEGQERSVNGPLWLRTPQTPVLSALWLVMNLCQPPSSVLLNFYKSKLFPLVGDLLFASVLGSPITRLTSLCELLPVSFT